MKQSVLVLILICCALCGRSQEWVQQYQLSVELYDNMELGQAKSAAEAALQSHKATMDPDKNLAVILRQLSIVCYELGESDLAITYAQEEVSTLQGLGLDTDLNFANTLHNLGIIRMSRSEYGAAEPILSEASRIGQDFLEPDSYELAVIKGNLAVTLFNLKKDDEAEVLFSESLDVLENLEEIGLEYYSIIYGYSNLLSEKSEFDKALLYLEELEDFYSYDKPSTDYGAIQIKIGDVLDQLGRFAEAVVKFQSAVDTYKALNDTISVDYSIALNNLSIELQKTGEFDQAFALMEELLGSKKLQKDEKPLEYAQSLMNYSNLLIRNGDRSAALKQLENVFALYEGGIDKDLTYVNALEAKSGLELEGGNRSIAEEDILEALTLAEELVLKSKYYSLYNTKAKVFARNSKYSTAKEAAEKAQSLCLSQFGDRGIQTAFINTTYAGILAELGEYGSAKELYEKVIDVFKEIYGPENPETAKVIANYSSLLQSMGNYYDAEVFLLQAIEIKRAAYGADNPDYLTTYENLALLYQNTARYTAADQILTEIVGIKEKVYTPTSAELAYTYLNLGSVKKQQAEYTEAEQYLKRAVAGYKSSLGANHIFYAGALNSMALLYQKMGNLQAAKPLFNEALKIYEGTIGKENPDYATALENLATLYQLEENYPKAKQLLEEALVIDQRILGTDHPLYSKTLHNLASIYEKNKEHEEAKELYLQALAIDERVFGIDHPSYASTLYNLAVLEQELEDYESARKHYEQVVGIRKKVLGEGHPDYTFALYGYASILHKTNELEAAREPYQLVVRKYLEYIEKYFPALSESEKSAFFSRIRPVLEGFMDYSVEFVILNKGTEIDRNEMLGSLYDLQLATKALLLNASNKVRNRINSSGDQELIRLFNEWISTKESLVKAYSMSVDEIQNADVNIPELEAKSNELEKRLSLKSQGFASEFEKKTITWQDVRNTLGAEEAVVEVIRIEKKVKNDSVLYAALILRKGVDYPILSLKADGIKMESTFFKAYKNSILFKIQDTRSYDAYWSDIDKNLAGVSTVYLSADGVLNKVNISTLYDTSLKKYVVEKYKIRLLSNSRELVEASHAQNPTSNALMFGFPKYNIGAMTKADSGGAFADESTRAGAFGSAISELPGTLIEVNNIESILNGGAWTTEKFLAEAATEDEVKQVNSPKILHIATHGFFLEDITVDETQGGISSRSAKFNPLLRSGLLFAGAENTWKNEKLPGREDGILTAYEAMNLNLDNTELVVMSACETGLGEVKNGEGVYGLQRSFLVAGADNLIMSLWKVNDETTQLLMSAFYKNWFSGQPRLDAFSMAINEVKNSYKDPYYWGAFVILGK